MKRPIWVGRRIDAERRWKSEGNVTVRDGFMEERRKRFEKPSWYDQHKDEECGHI